MLPLALALALTAQAGNAVSVQYDSTVAAGTVPALRLIANEALHAGLALSCDGRPVRWAGDIASGDTHSVSLDAIRDVGHHHCDGSLDIRAATGATGSMALRFDVGVLTSMAMTAAFEDIDLAGGMVTVHADRPIADLTVRAIGAEGTVVGRGSAHPSDPNPQIQWFPNSVEVVRLELEAHDADGVGATLALIPWSYAIPHTDVVFETNLANLQPEEVPKLEDAWEDVQRVLATYGDVVEISLYVGGYTDTVGPAGANLALSGRRARAIAAWFRARGFRQPISYRGLGESVLAVPTADGIDDVRNRRAVYVLAANPPVSDNFPPGPWSTLP